MSNIFSRLLDCHDFLMHTSVMSKELREKADRFAKSHEIVSALCPITGYDAMADAAEICRAYVAERPADDDEPLEKSWLFSVGGEKDYYEHPDKVHFSRHDALAIGFWSADDGWKAMLIHHENAASCIVRGLKTRGEFRRLCAVLGIRLP